MGLVDRDRPRILMLLDERREADAIAVQMRKRGARVAVRFLTVAQVDAEAELAEKGTFHA